MHCTTALAATLALWLPLNGLAMAFIKLWSWTVLCN